MKRQRSAKDQRHTESGWIMKRLAPVIPLLVLGVACNPADPLGLLNLSFRLENTEDFTVCGIVLDSLESLGPAQVAEVLAMWADGEVPVEMVLNVGVRNPNDGSPGTLLAVATIVDFPWKLYADASDSEGFDTTWVASGQLLDPFEVPGDTAVTILPLEVSFNAVAVLSVMDPLAFIDLALAVGGIDGDIRDDDHLGRLLLRTLPSVDTPFGEITYPDTLNVHLDWAD